VCAKESEEEEFEEEVHPYMRKGEGPIQSKRGIKKEKGEFGLHNKEPNVYIR